MHSPTPRSIAQARPARPVRATLALAVGVAALLVLHGRPAAAAGPDGLEGPDGAGTPQISSDPSPLPAQAGRRLRLADFQRQPASSEVRHVAHWALDSGDNGGKPYMIIDKVNARVFVFDAQGQLQGAEPALLGMGVGDVAAGIGALRLAAIRPQDRITPAGRFVASLDRDLKGQEILWVDYDDSLALHRVVKGQPSERRAERLQSATVADNRITYGCINVPVRFYEDVVSRAFRGTSGIVYILPEASSARDLFDSYEVGATTQAGDPAQP
jgi:hypothetical protein